MTVPCTQSEVDIDGRRRKTESTSPVAARLPDTCPQRQSVIDLASRIRQVMIPAWFVYLSSGSRLAEM